MYKSVDNELLLYHVNTMETRVEHYLETLPCEERHFVKLFLQLVQAGSNTQPYDEKLLPLLTHLPYPLLQILQHSRENSKIHIDRVVMKALNLLLAENEDSFSLHFINFLANFPLSALEDAALRKKLLEILSSKNLSDEAYLALISRPDGKLLPEVLDYLKQKWETPGSGSIPSNECVLFQALDNKLHFAPLVGMELKDPIDISDIALRNNLLILKVVNELSNTTQKLAEVGNIANWLKEFSVADVPHDLQEVHKFFYADFQRFCLVLEFLKKYPDKFNVIAVESLLNVTGILELIFKYNISASFEDARSIIESMYKWQQQIPATKCVHDIELETLIYYTALTTVYDVIISEKGLSPEQYYSSKIQQLNMLFRQMRNLDVLCSLIEDIFQMMFLRWEHQQHDAPRFANLRPSGSKSTNSSSSDSSGNAGIRISARYDQTLGIRHGFICSGQALYTIVAFLKNFVTKKLHSEDYKHSSDRIQMRFQCIVNIIGEALWKYSVIEKIDDSLARTGTNQKYPLDAEDLLQLVKLHMNPMEKSSSDDESRDRCNFTSLTRRKVAKKKRRATFSGAAVTRPNHLEKYRVHSNFMTSSVSAVQGATIPEMQLKTRNMIARFVNRSIIPKMLGSPENLAIMALALQNFNDVKHIIETFNLRNTDLNRELSFVEQQQQVKQKLATIYASYQKQENNSNNREPKATVEQIKNVAAKGFEVSKIISVIDNFAQLQKVQQSAELKQLLLKYSTNPQYIFLHQFEERNLNAVIITDLILNLPFNREITSNVLIVIKRQQQIASGIVKNFREDATVKVQLPKDMGAMPLLENLCECMRHLEHKSLSDLFYNNYYSLKPRKLAMELQRERGFETVFYKSPSEVGCFEDMKAHASHFQNLQSKCNYYTRFSAYIAHLAKLLQLREHKLHYHTSELLKIDPCDIIGELIFECGMTPFEIEANVSALNLNLVHVISLNICPEIGGKCNKTTRSLPAQKLHTIFNYISNQNSLLAYLLQKINKITNFVMSNNINPVFLQRFVLLPEMEKLAALYEGNTLVAALRSDNFDMKLMQHLDSKQNFDILQHQIGNCEPRHKQAKRIDAIIIQLIREDSRNMYLATQIHDISLRAKLIQENFTKISTTRLAKELIESTLHHKEAVSRIPHSLRAQLEATLADITIYAKVSEVLQFETWPQAYDFGLKTPNAIFEKLLQLHLYKLCYKWCRAVKLAERFVQHKRLFLAALLNSLLELNDEQAHGVEVNTYLLQIFETFPMRDCITFLDTNKDSFRSVVLLQYVINFLAKNARDDNNYKNYKVSLIIFEHLTLGERDQFWNLLKFPLLIIEQLIMNAKFEILTKVLTAVRKSMQHDSAKVHEDTQLCPFCFDKRGNIYDVHMKAPHPSHKVRFQLGTDTTNSAHSAFILLNFNLYQKDHVITNECIDLLLRIYATKALDYHVSDMHSSQERISQTTDTQNSLDSLCGAFQLPKLAPNRDDWVRDDEATHCMCCRRAAFTMLMRRHHCRRCGRVVCFACSTHRMRIPELYAEVEVRICNDCHRIADEEQRKSARYASADTEHNANCSSRAHEVYCCKWKLSGNITHDKLLREEFCYEHAPSVALCLSILGYHLGQQKCVDLLLYHCRELEKLIIPNPEVDYELIAKMMNCLALAAKVRGGPAEVETIREHSEIIKSVVHNGCESLLPPGPLNNHSLRKLADSLVQAEKWQLALEVHLKCGFTTAGVMAAHGLACLRAGCFDTAREKFSHCMSKLSNELINLMLLKCIMNPNTANGDSNHNPSDLSKECDIPNIKRPQRGPPLLQEIFKIIESIPFGKPQPETLQRASIIRNSNTSLASLISRRKDPYVIPMHEPALNVLTTLANLKRITKGHYSDRTCDQLEHLIKPNFKQTQARGFEECMHYVLTYGSHADVLQLLMRHREVGAALKYFTVQNLEADLFIHNVFLVSLLCGEVPALIAQILECDGRLLFWRTTLIQTCRYLEIQNLLNSLYQLQILLKDPVRASMTCVKFYSMNCDNFQQLHANAQHLHNAHRHLQSELEISQWENINMESAPLVKSSSGSRRASVVSFGASFLMQMDARALNGHINTILKQLDVAKFLASCEKENSSADGIITEKYVKQIRMETGKIALPTLFDSAQEKIQICILILLCGKNIEEGFGLAYRIIQDYKLEPMKVFAACAKYLALNQRLLEVEKLLNCITSNNGTNSRDIDEILSITVYSAIHSHKPDVKTALDILVKRIHSVDLRISCHIFIGQLTSAYLLANKYERLVDIRKILRQAELTNQVHIKKLCEKKLNMIAPQPE